MKDGDSLIFDNFEKRLEIHFSPEIEETKRGFNRSDYTLAQLLTWLKSFNELILAVRKEINFTTPLPFPKNANVDELVDFTFKALDNEKREIVFNKAKVIAKKYHLTDNWEFSIELAILTHTFLVPAKDVPIRVHLPSYFYPEEKKADSEKNLKTLGSSLSSPEIMRARAAMRIIGYPAIYLTGQVSVDELKKWINTNRELIRVMQSRLPKRKVLKRDDKTLFWGQVVWILRQEGFRSWSKMVGRIEELIEDNKKEGMTQEESEHYADIPPEPQELEKYYTRFIESLTDIQPT